MGISEALFAGLITFFSPCIIALLPVWTAYLLGGFVINSYYWERWQRRGLRASRERFVARRTLYFQGSGFLLGFSLGFVLLGAGGTTLGQWTLLFQNKIMLVMGWGLFLASAFVFRLLPEALLSRMDLFPLWRGVAGFGGSLFVGGTLGIAWVPCVGPVVGSIYLLAGSSELVWHGILLLSLFSAGLCILLMIFGVFFVKMLGGIINSERLLKWGRRLSGAFLLFLGLLVATGGYSGMNNWILQTFEPWVDWLIALGI